MGYEGEPPAAALAVPQGFRPPDAKLDKLCEVMRKRFQPNLPPEVPPSCMMRFGPEPQGVWGIIRNPPATGESALDWRMVYVSPAGRVIATPKQQGDEPSIDAITDFDRDGSPEVVLGEMFSTDSAGGSRNSFSIWTLKGGKLQRYGPAKGLAITWLVDQDADGVPEIMLDPYQVSVGSSSGWSAGLEDWSIIARADEKGRFVKTGPVPESYASALCPKPPDRGRLLDDNPRCHALDVHCARLWGVGTEQIKRALEQSCKGRSPDPMCDGSLDAWKKMAETEPPFVLANPNP